MSDAAAQAELHGVIATLDCFDEAEDVTLGDWSVLDRPVACAPYAIIRRSQRIATSKGSLRGFRITWQVPVILVVAFDSWDQAESDLADLRQQVLDLLLVQSPRIGVFAVESITDSGDFAGLYLDGDSGPYPVYLSQELSVTVSELV